MEGLVLNSRVKGYTLIELTIFIVISIIILLGMAKGILEFSKHQKRTQLLDTSRMLMEKIYLDLESKPKNYFGNLIFYQTNATCDFNGTCSFDEYCFSSYSTYRYRGVNCLPGFNCRYCLQGSRLIPTVYNCTSGYQLDVEFEVSLIINNQTLHQDYSTYGVCLKVYFRDPIYNKTQEYRDRVIFRKWD